VNWGEGLGRGRTGVRYKQGYIPGLPYFTVGAEWRVFPEWR